MFATLLRSCPLVVLATTCWTLTAHAQFNGHNGLGDYGLRSASQPDPGFYASAYYYHYGSDKIRNQNGDLVTLSPTERGSIAVNALAGFFYYVSDAKILGANYGAIAAVPFANATLAVPILGFEEPAGVGLGDVYVVPINLGWHTTRADFAAGVGVFVPTGRYDVDANDNIGLGMWSFELYGGATVYFDEAKSWHVATTAFYETHTDKKDTDIRVGDLLSLEGGFGKSFLEGALSVGAAYYAQWKISSDNLGLGVQPPGGPLIGKHRVFAAGPEVTVPIPIGNKLIAFITARYFWEFGAKTKSEGNALAIMATFPIPSIPIER